jgi:hypothetical protein
MVTTKVWKYIAISNYIIITWDYIDNLFDKCVDSGISNCIFLGDINVEITKLCYEEN